jgi:hypothetical protein
MSTTAAGVLGVSNAQRPKRQATLSPLLKGRACRRIVTPLRGATVSNLFRQRTLRRPARGAGRFGEAAGALAERGVAGEFLGATGDGSFNTSSAEALRARRATRPWYIIDPRSSLFMASWDAIAMVAILYTACVTPYEVALLDPPGTWADAAADALFILNRLVDAVFLLDFVLNFVVMVQAFDEKEGVRWIDDPSIIAGKYLRGWFTLDVVSLVPSAFDLIPLALDQPAPSRWRPCAAVRCLVVSSNDSGAEVLARFKALRVLRVFRLVKLVRLLRASRLLKRWETRISINYATLQVRIARARTPPPLPLQPTSPPASSRVRRVAAGHHRARILRHRRPLVRVRPLTPHQLLRRPVLHVARLLRILRLRAYQHDPSVRGGLRRRR